ncbi:membrane cofactor protein-like isoform X2 [Dromiciops gliroides]|uniref:membrane cofactor protein-like isoform X2 n=1 Tax=Dromiciops gliroides TaxID=33562 RepID=UPI001CC4C119|nr:membrane cofactor protein-like isoform X2 [Dromiciops gliroides]
MARGEQPPPPPPLWPPRARLPRVPVRGAGVRRRARAAAALASFCGVLREKRAATAGAWLPALGLLGVLPLLGLPLVSGDCGTLPSIPHAHPEENYDADKTFGVGTTIVYRCDTDYVKLPGKSDSVTCQGVEWSKISEFCDRSCEAPQRFSTMQLHSDFISKNYFPINSSVTFVCRPGHTPSKLGRIISICQENGTWSPVSGSCKRKSCPNPEALPNGQIEVPEDILFGSQIEYFCDEGYELIGDAKRMCEVHENKVLWSGEVPFCKMITCGPPPEIPNGKHSGAHKDIFNYAETVTYSCDSSGRDGFSLIGEATIFCKQNKEWSNSPPQCKEVICKTPQVDNAVQISGFGSIHTYKDTIAFSCKDGYTLQNNDKITCEADNNWSPELPVCKKVPVPSPSEEPPVSSSPGPSLPPSKEPAGPAPGIIALIAIASVAVVVGIIVAGFQHFKKKKGYCAYDQHHQLSPVQQEKGKNAEIPVSANYKACRKEGDHSEENKCVV